MSNTYHRIQNLINHLQDFRKINPKNQQVEFENENKKKLRILKYKKLENDYFIDSDGDIATEFYEATSNGQFKKIFPL